MREWLDDYDLEGLDSDFLAIRSLLISGHIKSMRQLDQQSPTKIALLLGINYNSYHDKLKDPGLFTEAHVNLLAHACRLDPFFIQDIIKVEIKKKIELAYEKYEIKLKLIKAKRGEKDLKKD